MSVAVQASEKGKATDLSDVIWQRCSNNVTVNRGDISGDLRRLATETRSVVEIDAVQNDCDIACAIDPGVQT
jgi:hypothetical protein